MWCVIVWVMKSVLNTQNNEKGRVDHARSTVKGSDRNPVRASSVLGRVVLVNKERLVASMDKAVEKVLDGNDGKVQDDFPAAVVESAVKVPCKSCKPSARLLAMQRKGKSVFAKKVSSVVKRG